MTASHHVQEYEINEFRVPIKKLEMQVVTQHLKMDEYAVLLC